MKLSSRFSLALLAVCAAAVAWFLAGKDSVSSPASVPTIDSSIAAKMVATSSPADHAFFTTSEALSWRKKTPPSGDRVVSLAELRTERVADLPAARLKPLAKLLKGESLSFAFQAEPLRGEVRSVVQAQGWLSASGSMADGGSFTLKQEVGQSKVYGQIVSYAQQRVYRMVSNGLKLSVQELPLDAALCAGMPRAPGERPTPAQAAGAPPPPAPAVPSLDSRPTAAAVIYLDFDGETITDPEWNFGATIYAQPAVLAGLPISSAQITDVYQRVAEDFAPFNVTVTTLRSRYDAAPVGRRAYVVITPTDSWYAGNAGGVAYFKSFRGPYSSQYPYSTTVPCWVWNSSNTSVMAMTVSHEVGHMMDLSHDGDGSNTYYAGHGSGFTSWGPIMGAPFYSQLNQWNDGDYPGANNTEDDLAITHATIGESGGPGLVVDDAGNTPATARALSITSPVTQAGQITDSADVDCWSFNALAGNVTFSAKPLAVVANLDAQLVLFNSTGTELVRGPLSSSSLDSTLSFALPAAGTYYLQVEGKGRAGSGVSDPGYSAYGSMGNYTLSGTYSPLPQTPIILTQPTASTTVNQGTRVTLRVTGLSNRPLTYAWRKNGVIIPRQVASSLALLGAPDDNATYDCVVTNSVGSITSDPAVVEVLYKPIILTQPTPALVTVPTGSSTSWTISARGTATVSYQWKKNNVNLPGETSTTLALTNVDWFSAGSYTCVVSNAQGFTTSLAAKLTVTSAPLITVPPPTRVPVALGARFSIKATAVGTGAITFKWFKDGTEIPAMRSAILSFAAAKLTDEAVYHCIAINALGQSSASSSTQVDVQDKPVILTHPVASIATSADSPVTLSCTASGTPTLIYQWQRNGVNVPGAVGETLNIPAISWLQRGVWRCMVSNEVGVAYTKNCSIAVTSYPVIITQPVNTKIAVNGTGVLRVVAEGTPTLRYQWFKDNVALLPVTSSLTLAKATVAATNGDYKVRVYNAQGEVYSQTVAVAVEDPPKITVQPLSIKPGLGTSASFTITATGSPTLNYQWYKNNVLIPAANAATYTVPLVVSTSSGYYTCVVSNAVGKVTSARALLTPVTSPSITKQPLSQTVYLGDKVVLTVTVSGSQPMTYQWFVDGSPIPSGGTTTTLTIPSLPATATYTFTATNSAGTVTSDPAVITGLTVPPPTVTDVRPLTTRRGHRVMVTGTNFTWMSRVTVNGVPATYTITRPTEMFVTIPATATSGLLSVQTRGGTISAAPLTVHTLPLAQQAPNTLLSDALIMPFTTPSILESSNASLPYPGVLWFRWRAPRVGTYRLNLWKNSYHSFGYIYSGPVDANNSSQLRYLGYMTYHWGLTDDVGYIDLRMQPGQDYYFEVRSNHSSTSSGDYLLKGPTSVHVYYTGAAPRDDPDQFEKNEGYTVGALAGQQHWEGQGTSGAQVAAVNSGAGQAIVLGGQSAKKEPTLVWKKLPPSSTGTTTGVRVSTQLRFSTPSGARDQFVWQGYDAIGEPLLALTFHAESQRVSYQLAGGPLKELNQSFLDDVDYDLEFYFDHAAAKWQASLNGVPIITGAVLPKAVADISAGWVPGTADSPASTMKFDALSLQPVDDTTPSPAPPLPEVAPELKEKELTAE